MYSRVPKTRYASLTSPFLLINGYLGVVSMGFFWVFLGWDDGDDVMLKWSCYRIRDRLYYIAVVSWLCRALLYRSEGFEKLPVSMLASKSTLWRNHRSEQNIKSLKTRACVGLMVPYSRQNPEPRSDSSEQIVLDLKGFFVVASTNDFS